MLLVHIYIRSKYILMFKKSDLVQPLWFLKFYEQNNSLFAPSAIRCLGFAWIRAARRSGARERDHMAEEMRYLEISFKQRSPIHNVANKN